MAPRGAFFLMAKPVHWSNNLAQTTALGANWLPENQHQGKP
jgi:hypothetical protein